MIQQVILLLFFSTTSIHAEDKSTTKTLWDSWYTIKVYDNIPFSFYNETVEDRGEQIHFQQKMWKKEKDSIIEEHIGLLSKNNEELTPILFNFFRSNGLSSELIIDGTLNEKNSLHIKMREAATVKSWNRQLPKETFLATFFPVWISKHWSKFKVGKKINFRSIVEDSYQTDYPISPGWVKLEKEDKFSKTNKTQKFTVRFRDATSYWWVKPSGQMIQMEMPEQNAVVELTTETKAKEFLKNGK